jgi:hypothetical protein
VIGQSLYALVICIGIGGCIATVGLCVVVCLREADGRPVLPFGARIRVERAKAHTEIMGEQLKQDATEIKRLALDHQRTLVLDAITKGENEEVMRLGLPSAEPAYNGHRY